ncbi:NUDIX hydrolase [Rhodopseudomonas palustris]|uniref:NUDIX hydrolase n=1 Tax=Rhodopseudomonas palustris (strain BisB18) TaxID=316056 RepID=Q21A93_RHOPB
MKLMQYGALPFRLTPSGPEILLVTTRNKRRWSVPKGWPIKHHSPHQTAEIEAREEAGLEGSAHPRPVGRFKHRRVKRGEPVTCEVRLFPMQVIKQHEMWPERLQRERRWLPAGNAAAMVHKRGLKKAIRSLMKDELLKAEAARSDVPKSDVQSVET